MGIESPRSSESLPDDTHPEDTAQQRAALAQTIRRFLNSELSAFEFDEALDEYRHSDDPIIQHVVRHVWFFYDDLKDHQVALNKPEWDYFQRLLLLLASDCRMETRSVRTWSWTQAAAGVCLALFVFAAIRYGWGQQLLVISLPFGVASVLISRLRERALPAEDPLDEIIHPFATWTDLRTARATSPFFKTPYPRHMAGQSIRSPFLERFYWLLFYFIWLMLAPIPLYFQMRRIHYSQTVARAN